MDPSLVPEMTSSSGMYWPSLDLPLSESSSVALRSKEDDAQLGKATRLVPFSLRWGKARWIEPTPEAPPNQADKAPRRSASRNRH